MPLDNAKMTKSARHQMPKNRGMGNLRKCGMRKVICGTKSAEWKWLVDGHHHVISPIPQITIPTFRAWRGDNLQNLWCGIAVANNGKRRKRCKT